MIEAATVDLPFFTISAGTQVTVTMQAQIKRDEIERASDPRDSGDHMNPPDSEFEPSRQGSKIVHIYSFGLLVAGADWRLD